MTAFYNENDPFAADWLEALIAKGLIAPGVVDRRSITEIDAWEVAEFTQVHWFAGIGGWSCALRLAGWPDDRPVWTGSCPCQPFSQAGKRKGFADDRHLWPVWFDLIRNARPGIVFGEQVASATEWLGLVRSDMGSVDYVLAARPFEAASAGADHLRNRIGFVAYSASAECERKRPIAGGLSSRHSDNGRLVEGFGPCWWAHDENKGRGKFAPANSSAGDLADTDQPFGRIGNEQPARQFSEQQQDTRARASDFEWVIGADGKARRVKPGIRLLVDGFPNRVGLLRGFGNAIDPRAFAQFIGAADEAMNECR